MMFDLKGKTAVVTGGGSGIGRAISLLFAKQGATVFILDYDKKTADTVAEEAVKAGGSAEAFACDVSNQQQVKDVVESIAAKTRGVQLLVNNAGVAHVGTVETTSEEDFNRLLSVNVRGVYNCLQAVIPHMKHTGGAILNMASIASSVGLPDRFAYSMTKGAVVGMTLSVAKDYIGQKIRCNCISPARVHTPFVDGFISKNYPGNEQEMFEKLSRTQPIGRMAEPEEIAYLVLYLCSDEASFITGCDYPIDGGFIKLNN
ncbi:SDR family oxidoreductase [Terrimonas sp. NA20]|uniref:SDR family oxidoreductase n=1 Tax=Terrimonas ginsenosidimutans TaxID=2908004 RepID=A0ABS9KNB7_9BACT|nr:SDR family oxidoreductase [Terrimonas ginsenosidimutans]MCG2613821.1 SDR family oxidoreductase [Terrimonas ginsenosidimutans]